MPRSSRSKSHKQSKHSSKEYSDLDEDVKTKDDTNDGKKNGVSVKVSKDSLVSGEKRKLSKDLSSSHTNGSVSEEYATPSKRRKEKVHGGSDRWSGDGGEEKSEVVNVDDKKLKSKDSIKVAGESKSKTSRTHDVESSSVMVVEKDESKNTSGSRGEKRSDKESGRKEGRHSKENKESKDKDRGSEKERKIHDSKQVENQPSKRGREHNEWAIEEELRNIELEKELEKRMRRREGKYHNDAKDDDERTLSSKSGHKHKDESRTTKKDSKHKDDKYREDGEKGRREDKYREDGNNKDSKNLDDKYRVERNRDDKKRQDDERDYRHKEERYREDDHKHKNNRSRDETDREKRSKNRDSHYTKNLKENNRSRSPTYDKHKEDKDRRRDDDKDEVTDDRSRSNKDQLIESEKRSVKIDPNLERGRTSSRNDMENHSRHRSPSSSRFYPTRDHHRYLNSDKISSRPSEKMTQKDENYMDDLSAERHRRSDARPSPRVDERNSEYSEKVVDGGDNNMSVSRNGHFSGNHKSFPPPQTPFRTGSERVVQNNWKNIPNWPSPLANGGGYIPFQHHIPPPPMFNPAMQQFVPPIFGRPPPMQMNHGGDRFSGHGHPLSWMEESIPTPLHNWETNNPVFGDGSHGYGWDHHGRTQLNNSQTWDPNTARKNDRAVNGPPTDDVWSGQQAENEDSEVDVIQDEKDINKTQEISKVTEIPQISQDEKEEDPLVIPRTYLSKIHVSEDLTQTELYDQCTSILALDKADEFDCKILFLEAKEGGVEDDISNGGLLFADVDDSVFKKAMSIYRKHKVEFVEEKKGVNEKNKDDEEMDLLVELGSVNVSRIHDDDESTH